MDREEVFQTVELLIGDWADKYEYPTPNRLDVFMNNVQDLVPAVAGLRVKRLGYLTAITGLDTGIESEDLEILYHFCTGPNVVTLRFLVPKRSACIPSLCSLVPSAEAYEREISEMFGIKVEGLRNEERLYLPDEWQENIYPLRKGVDLSVVNR